MDQEDLEHDDIVNDLPLNDLPANGLPVNGLPVNNPVNDDSDDDSDGEGVVKISIPVLPKLKGDHNLGEWKESVRAYCDLMRLTKFIDHAATPPSTTASKKKTKYNTQKVTVYLMIRNSVAPVMDIVKSHGWQDGTSDPQALFDKVCAAIGNDEGWCNIAWELMAIDANAYDNLRAFNARYHYLVAKLKDLQIVIPDKLLQAILLKGLKNYDASR